MKTFKILALATVALGAAALATPAQARDRHHHDGRNYRHWDGHRHGRVVVYSTPRYYYSRSYYRPYYYDDYYSPGYSYYRPYSYYGGGPSISFAFGGHGYRHWHHHR